MSRDIIIEVYFLLGAIATGILITFVYDFILIGRQVVKHNLFFISLEDFLFWTACAITVFYMLYEENNGILRWFAVLGAAFGMLLYKRIIGKHFVRITAAFIEKEIHIIRKIIGFIFRPVVWLLGKIRVFFRLLFRKEKKLNKYIQKKLTVYKKMLKITLHKH